MTKSTLSAADIIKLTKLVTKEWTRQRKAEERGRSRATRQYLFSRRVDFTEVAGDILPGGYAHASGGGQYTVDKRQFYYAVREQFREATGREIDADYFSQKLLVQYMNEHPAETKGWKITAQPRGTITIPHAAHEVRIPCGTLAVEEHLHEAERPVDPFEDIEGTIPIQWPSLAEGQRFQGVLYIEKEGFDPQLREARIAETFGIAIIGCKGQSVVAARKFVDHACRVSGGVDLLIIHDMDKAGFEISKRLTSVSDHLREKNLVKYEFKNEVKVFDLGLRLSDVQKYGLQSERFDFKGRFTEDSIATPEEQAFLRSNRRVELNAFTAPQIIEWITEKLTEHFGKRRLVPSDEIIEKAYRRALVVARINGAIETVRATAIERARQAAIPKNIRRSLQKKVSGPDRPWDKVLYDLAQESLLSEDGDD
jgi:hypothetical protein